MSKEKTYKKSEFPLFNDAALKSSNENVLTSSTIDKNMFTRYNDGSFNQKINLEQNSDILRRKRCRKSKNEIKDVADPNITIKEIIENQKAGIPTEKEKKMKEERLKKMHEKRNEKKMIKNIDSSNISPEKDNISNSKEFSSPEDNILANLDSNPNENIHSAEKSIKIVNGKIQIAYLDVRANEDNKIITVGNNKPEKTTSMSFRQRNHTEKWTPEETKKFFKALEFFGSDFSMIAKFFNNRNRAQIKNKFRKEERENPETIDRAFKRHRLSDKTKIKERLSEINNMIENPGQNASIEYPEKTEELKKNLSNSSTDSTDMKLIDELVSICKSEEKEIREKTRDKTKNFLQELNETQLPNVSTSTAQNFEKSQEGLNTYNLLSSNL